MIELDCDSDDVDMDALKAALHDEIKDDPPQRNSR